MTEIADFVCPRCNSHYKHVRVHADPELASRLIDCRVCKEPFAPTDGEYVLKYFLVDKVERLGDGGCLRFDDLRANALCSVTGSEKAPLG
jgi:hypothetical protein